MLSLFQLSVCLINICSGQFYRVQVGIQSPQGVTTLRGVLRRFNDFMKLLAAVRALSCYILEEEYVSFVKN